MGLRIEELSALERSFMYVYVPWPRMSTSLRLSANLIFQLIPTSFT